MCGVERTRGPSMPMKLMAFSLVTSSVCSLFVPTGMWAIPLLCPGQARQHAAHVAERPLHAVDGILGVDLVFQVHAALVIHFLELLENPRERHDAVAHVHLAVPGLFLRRVFE